MEPTNFDLISGYLSQEDAPSRVAFLKSAKSKGHLLSPSFVNAMLRVDLGPLEKACLVTCLDTDNQVVAEEFLTGNITDWGQETAATAIRIWASATSHGMWHRIAALTRLPILPQRLKYTLAETCAAFNPAESIRQLVDSGDITEYSETYHSLMLRRAVEHHVNHRSLVDLAKGILNQQQDEPFLKNKATPFAMTYLAWVQPDLIERYTTRFLDELPWLEHSQHLNLEFTPKAFARTFLKLPLESVKSQWLQEHWPAIHQREKLSAECLGHLLDLHLKYPSVLPAIKIKNKLLGCDKKTILSVLPSKISGENFQTFLSTFECYLPKPMPTSLAQELARYCQSEKDKIALGRFSAEYLPAEYGTHIREEQEAFVAGKNFKRRKELLLNPRDLADKEPKLNDFAHFLQVRNSGPRLIGEATTESTFYGSLARAWCDQELKSLNDLAAAARKQSGINQLFYIETLGRFRQRDEAVLKLLDYTRSEKPEELLALIRALASIDSTRSKQELVHCVTRPNFATEFAGVDLRTEAVSLLVPLDVQAIQTEIRNSINDLRRTGKGEDHELSMSLSGMLLSENTRRPESIAALPFNDADLDQDLNQIIPGFLKLSSEVRRALRTAKFFHHHTDRANNADNLDLSPLIDMQYKALELLFRETFENYCNQIIQRAALPNKLDVIGYARPIPQAMDEFENYIAKMPVIRDIPFFSKFKLRKMLRALCLFRPGKRFTLDGLKAFALFFLCFSRSSCRYGLANLAPLGFASDAQLYEFSKQLHIFQDFRNRAAHEGFHPEVRDDVDGIWLATSSIIATCLQVQDYIEAESQEKKSKVETTFIKKVS
jgi:hypothetical protein